MRDENDGNRNNGTRQDGKNKATDRDEKPLNNPFATLDKKQFRQGPDKKGRIRPVLAVVEPVLSPVTDADLFIEAMRSVAPLQKIDDDSAEKKQGSDGQDYDAGTGLTFLQTPLLRDIRKAGRIRETQGGPAVLASDHDDAGQMSAALTRRELARNKSRTAVDRAQMEAEKPEVQADDVDLFSTAMASVAPLQGKGREVPPELPPPPPIRVAESNPLQDFMEGKLEFALASTDEYVEGHVVGLDLILVGKLQAGQFSPEGHVDLHGLNAQQAFQTLLGFIRGAYLKGQRTVLVVPGRGRNSPSGMGVLREKVQDWFTQEPFRRVVLAFCTARPTDGGAGALYVMLRKFRKDRGKVYWERRPADPDLM